MLFFLSSVHHYYSTPTTLLTGTGSRQNSWESHPTSACHVSCQVWDPALNRGLPNVVCVRRRNFFERLLLCFWPFCFCEFVIFLSCREAAPRVAPVSTFNILKISFNTLQPSKLKKHLEAWRPIFLNNYSCSRNQENWIKFKNIKSISCPYSVQN